MMRSGRCCWATAAAEKLGSLKLFDEFVELEAGGCCPGNAVRLILALR